LNLRLLLRASDWHLFHNQADRTASAKDAAMKFRHFLRCDSSNYARCLDSAKDSLQEDLAVLCGHAARGERFFTGLFSDPARAQQTDPATPVVVQPGAPGKPSRRLPPSTKATLPPRSQADVEFMQGMIMPSFASGGE